jgi:hypothetical protein
VFNDLVFSQIFLFQHRDRLLLEQRMSSVQLKLPKSGNVRSTLFLIHVTVSDVDQQLIGRLCPRIEGYLRRGAEWLIIATNTVPTRFDFSCAIRYRKAARRSTLRSHIRYHCISPCFKLEGQSIGNRIMHVDVEPIDDSAFNRHRDMWKNNQPWNVIYEGPGAPSGLYIPLIGSRLQPLQFS